MKIGWSDTTRLSKIEQGHVGISSHKAIDKIFSALDLTEIEKSEVLEVSGLLITKEEAITVLKSIEEQLNSLHYPLIMVDMNWYTYYFNEFTKKLYKLTNEEYTLIKNQPKHWLELQFLDKLFNKTEIRAGYSPNKLRPFDEYLISHFKFEMTELHKKSWYNKLLLSLNKDAHFREIWQKCPADNASSHIYQYEFNEFTGDWGEGLQTLNFNVFSIYPSMDSRFAILVHIPANKAAENFINT